MERLAVVGLSWRSGGAQELARFTIPIEEQPDRLETMRRDLGAAGLIYLATCNRVEWIIDAEPGVELTGLRQKIFRSMTGTEPPPGEAERCFREWAGEGAIEHLFLVATGLDSAKVGETDVQSQVRGALERGREFGIVSAKLDLVLEEALRVARRIRRETDLGPTNSSLAEIAEHRIRVRLAETPGTVALIGVTRITERCGRSLAESGVPVLVVNRTLKRAQDLAERIGGQARELAEFCRDPDPVAVVLTSTGSAEPVLSVETLRALAARTDCALPPLILDLAIPADVDPASARAAGLVRLGMDEIISEAEQQRAGRLIDAAESRALVDEAVTLFQARLADWSLGPAFAALQQHYHDAALQSAEKVLRRELRTLGENERVVVRQWAESLARRLAHLPTAGMRGLAHEHGIPAVETFLNTAAPGLVRSLQSGPRANASPIPNHEKGALDGRWP